MKTARFALSALASLSFVALAGMSGCAYGDPIDSNESAEPSTDETASTEQNMDAIGDDNSIDPPELTVTTLATGDGWRRIRFLGRLVNADTGVTEQTDRTLVVIEGSSKIANAPVPSKIKQALLAEAALKSAAEANEPVAVDEKLANTYETQTYAPYTACNNDDKDYSKGVSGSKTKEFKKGAVAGELSGSVTITTTLSASANASLSVRRHRKNIFGLGCRTVWVDYKGLGLDGSATVTAALDAQATFEKSWEKSDEVVSIPLGSWVFSAGGFPVKVGFNIPITVGFKATGRATLNAKGSVTATGSFQVACTTSSCTAGKSGSLGYTPGGQPTVDVTGRVQVTPWAQAALRGYLYHEKLARAQVGIRADLASDMWGYAGNDCGDANNDGVNEQVEALTVDMQGKLSVTVDTAVANKSVYSNNWPVHETQHHFWDLIESSALDPIFYVASVTDKWNTVKGQMRPCYPYNDKMSYRIDWNSTAPDSSFVNSPQTLWTRSAPHSSAASGVTLTLNGDAAGRDIKRVVTRPYFKPIGGIIL